MKESEIEKKVCEYAEKVGFLQFKFSSQFHKGLPDRIFMRSGKVFFIEFKAKNKKPTLLQSHVHKLFKNQNLDVYVIDDVDIGKNLLNNLIKTIDSKS